MYKSQHMVVTSKVFTSHLSDLYHGMATNQSVVFLKTLMSTITAQTVL